VTPVSETRPVFFATPADLRAWLEENHETVTELWVGCYKKGTGKPSVTWPEVVDEALCVGWIDGIRRSIDEESYAIRLTPRRPRSNWSLVNLKRVPELLEAGRMRPAGLRAYEARVDARSGAYSFEQRQEARLDEESLQLFQAEPDAWAFFQAQPPSYRRTIVWWIISAKKPETRRRRLATLIQESLAGRRTPPLHRPERGESRQSISDDEAVYTADGAMTRDGLRVQVDEHPLLRVATFVTRFSRPLGELSTPPEVAELLRDGGEAPVRRDEEVRAAIRDLLRWGGYKPTGRGKPASEYLVRAVGEGALGSINPAVDACNAVSLHSGLPISVVDLALARPPFRIGVAPAGTSYVFNATGQEIDVAGLLCLFDADGPCANAVRDAQRTKTRLDTTSTLSVVWGTVGQEERLREATSWYRALLERVGAETERVP
jgi:uncharacterized protein YdeI (YjbR/CyaY-like superfamily)/DNA/RNA-binding domain of Phe-tRNA-synthetase-like protein